MGGFEAPHGRSALFGVVRRSDTVFAFEPAEISASDADLLVQSAMLRVGDGAGRVFWLDLVIDERIEQELFSHVLEEVLLSPALEHAVGDLDLAEIPSTRDHLCLVTVVAQARDLPQAQLAFEEPHRLIVQQIIHPAPVEFGATSDEPSLVDTSTPTFAIGEHVEPVVDHPAEQLR